MKIETIRHSLAHILAYAVKELYPEVKLGMGPDIENGFYYDFEFSKKKSLKPEDLSRVEEKMKELIKRDIKFVKKTISKNEAKKLFKDQPYKLELIKELTDKNVSIYISDGFIDLCKGPHIKNTKEISPDGFKLTKLAGAYWKGDEENTMLTRIYGTAFNSKKELDDYLLAQIEAEKRDHRMLGQKMELFLINEEIGLGLPLWLPKGAVVRKAIEDYLYKELTKEDYQWLYTPHIGSRKLWETSGHWNFYNENMYPPLEIGQNLEESQKGKVSEIKEEYLLKPMNCPFHAYVYNSKIRSYKDLPIKFAELGTVYRYEKSGTLHGLTRVRGFTQDDAHLICTPKQMPEEIEKLVRHALSMLKDFGFEEYNIYLSTRPKKYAGTLKKWEKATDTLKYVLRKLKLKYETDAGGGVFYGPKIDIKIKDSLSREWQCTTIQFDFNLPEKFKMSYVNERGKKEEPYMIHRALLGSMERFFGVLIESYAGALPFWLSPVQIEVIPVGADHIKYAESIHEEFIKSGIRSELNDKKETVSKKIREAEIQKIPYMIVVGDKEIKEGSIRIREREKGDMGITELHDFIKRIKME
ncbi:MAG: threonine--tRNA ligase [Candidatus Pacebacteria bacterium]|nr:threonine--tRNA ligase [Candidatus Paceibacterota bacterium]